MLIQWANLPVRSIRIGGTMQIGDLVLDKELDEMGIIIDLQWNDEGDEMCVVVQLPDNSTVLASYEELELIACSNL